MADGQSSNPSGYKINMSRCLWPNLPLNVVSPFESYPTFKGEKIKIFLLTLTPEHKEEKHKHQNEQISHIIKGKIKMRIGEEELVR